MDKRILYGCIAALGLMLGFDLLTQLSGWKLDLPQRTPLGMVFLGSLLTTFAAMTLGGWIAQRHFRWIAVVLSVVLWIAVIVVTYSLSPPRGVGAATLSLASIVKFNALAIALSLLASWLGAALGERLAARPRLPVSA